jgi:proteic killer suppression protein
VIRSFRNEATRDIYHGKSSKTTRRALPESLLKVARRKLDQLDNVSRLQDLGYPPSNHFEALLGDRKGQYSIRINEKYRVCFEWSDEGPFNVEITDYH